MGEEKYLTQLEQLVTNIISNTSDSLSSLKSQATSYFEEINTFINNSNNKVENSTNVSQKEKYFSNYFITQLRIKYQKQISELNSDDGKIISLAKSISEFIFWLIKEIKFITFQQSLKLLQDIVETIPIIGLEDLFNIVSNSLKNLEHSFIEQGKLDILLIHNIFLKRVNHNMNPNFRGKIILLYCHLFSISEKSGINAKGKYSQNQINDEISNYSNDNSDTVINDDENPKMEIEDEIIDNKNQKMDNKIDTEDKKDELKVESKVSVNDISLVREENEKIKFFEQFWVIEKILLNPFMVCIIIFNFTIIFIL